MSKITLEEFRKKLADPDIPETELRRFLIPDKSTSGPFKPNFRPNPELVEVPPATDIELESAIRIGNGLSRFRRQTKFRAQLALGDDRPILISEGDSWFQFPFLVDDIVDHLGEIFLIFSLGAAGDTADNIVFGSAEYKGALQEFGARADGFIFSAAGNDIIGEDTTGQPVLKHILKTAPAGSDPSAHINFNELTKRLEFLRKAYQRVVSDIRANPHLIDLPIFVHGYDFAIPGSKNDPRNPIHAEPDEWLGGPMREVGITKPATQRSIIRTLINTLYDMLDELAQKSGNENVFVVDVRDTLPNVSDWIDEIHGTDEGFRRVAAKFEQALHNGLKTRQGKPLS